VCDAHETLASIGLSVFERLPQVGGLGKHGSAVGSMGVEGRLRAVGGEGWGGHDGRVYKWVGSLKGEGIMLWLTGRVDR